MQPREPSRTAFAAARHRAAHQLLDGARIFADPLAVPILGGETALDLEEEGRPGRRALRFFIAVRSRLAEAALAEAVGTREVRQLVVLGAGLDTFAYRNPFPGRLKVFEVDHPATQAWKRRRLAEAGVAIPAGLTFAPVDFERDGLIEQLAAAGFDAGRRSFFTWLGVVPYLTEETIAATLAAVGALPGGAEVMFDYTDPPETLPEQARALHAGWTARFAAVEPFLSYFEPEDLAGMLRRLGFEAVEDLGPRTIAARYAGREIASDRGGHVVHAATAIRD
jgi:methyltransferase (TIGR00027 family)